MIAGGCFFASASGFGCLLVVACSPGSLGAWKFFVVFEFLLFVGLGGSVACWLPPSPYLKRVFGVFWFYYGVTLNIGIDIACDISNDIDNDIGREYK
jgi:hypothetical protein